MSKSTKMLFGLLSVALMLFGLAACKGSDSQSEVSSEELSVSLTSVAFNKEGGTQVLTISGVKNWTYFSNEGGSWLVTTKSGNELTLVAPKNALGKERKAELLISSVGGVQKVYVTQSASDLVFSFSEASLQFSHKAGEKSVQVATNSEEWSFEPIEESAQEWLTIESGEGAKTLILKVTENRSYKERTTTLIAKATNGEQVGLQVSQLGVAKYLLPYQPSTGSHNDLAVLSFEQERGSILQNYQLGRWDSANNKEIPTVIQFITQSDAMPMIAYQRNLDELKYTSAQTILYISDDNKQEELHEYVKLLEENGYVKDSNSTDLKWYYYNEKLAIDVTIQIQAGAATVGFYPYYPQTRDYPTFKSFPLNKDNWIDRLSNTKYKAADILRLENEAGSESTFTNMDSKNPTLYSAAGFKLAESSDPYDAISHTYWFYTTTPKNATDVYIQAVSEQAKYFSNVEWGIRIEGRRQIITNELDKLLKDEGYKYDSTSKDGKTYYYYKFMSPTEIRLIYVGRVVFNDVNGGKPALRIGCYTIFQPANNNAAQAGAAQEALQATKEGSFEALDYLHTSPCVRMYEAMHSDSIRR